MGSSRLSSRSIRGRGRRRRIMGEFELQLTSMMDVMVIIVVFLLKSYSASTHNLATINGIQIPTSASVEDARDSLQLIVTPEAMTFENERIVEFVKTATDAGAASGGYAFKTTDMDEGGRRILPLYDALMRAKDKSELLRAKSPHRDEKGNPLPFDGVLAIQADKRIEYDTLRKVMYTAGTAGYKVFRFIARKKDT